MRLVCPNCGAQYEVDDRVMPETGRDVQCSNCGHGWFQRPPAADSEPVAPPAPSPFDNIEDFDEVEDDYDDDLTDPDEPEPDPEPETAAEPEEAAATDAAESAPTAAPRELDDSVRSILQEEAERERKAREEERAGLETQPDLGLDEAPGKPLGTPEPKTDDTLSADTDEPLTTQDDLKGRDVLPDIEEINSTLDAPDDDAEEPEPEQEAEADTASSGFLRGFTLVVVLACLLAVLYIYAPAIGERFPAVQPALDQYVLLADKVRMGLEEMMRAAIGKMQGLLEQPEQG